MDDDRNRTPIAEEDRPIPKRVDDEIDNRIDEKIDERMMEERADQFAREQAGRTDVERTVLAERERAELAEKERLARAAAENRHLDDRTDRMASDRLASDRAEKVADATRPERTNAPRASRFIYWVLGVVEVLLGLRLVLRLVDANDGNAIVSLIYGISDVLIVPFRGIIAQSQTPGFDVQTLVAMVGYAIVGIALAKLIDVLTPNRY